MDFFSDILSPWSNGNSIPSVGIFPRFNKIIALVGDFLGQLSHSAIDLKGDWNHAKQLQSVLGAVFSQIGKERLLIRNLIVMGEMIMIFEILDDYFIVFLGWLLRSHELLHFFAVVSLI